MVYSIDISLALGTSKVGLTLAAQIINSSGGAVGSEITAGFVEIGQGNYLWHCTTMPDDHRGGVKFYEDGVPGTILALCAINPEEVEAISEITATAILTAILNSGPQVASVITSSAISQYRGDVWAMEITGLGDLTGYVSIDFTVKESKADKDTEALVRIRKNASGTGDGLLRLNGAEATAGNGSISIDNLTDGDITVNLKDVEAAKLTPDDGLYADVQVIFSTGALTKREYAFAVVADVTRLTA